jgi:glycosyltransferase involved in cell wall biosynthesis
VRTAAIPVQAEERRQPDAGAARRRVLFINDTARNGGPGRSLLYILKFLDPRLIHRSVLLPREGVISALLRDGGVADELLFEPRIIENLVEPLSRAMRREDFAASLPLKTGRAIANIGRAAGGLLSIVRRVGKGRFDLVYCNGTTACFIGGALARLTGVPVLWRIPYSSLQRPLQPLHRWLAASASVRSIVCVSNATTGFFRACGGKVRVIHNAIDIAEFDAAAVAPRLRTELGWDRDIVVFGSQGRILRRKGYLEMIGAAHLALGAMTPAERRLCRFVVLGDTPADMRLDHLEECRALVRELGLDEAFRFIGYREDVRPYVADFDIAVVPSVYADPLPRAVMEAMALAKPVVAFALGGIPEMVEAGVSGALIGGDPPDAAGMAAAFVRYLRDPELRRRHGAAARRRAELLFDARAVALRLQEEMLRIARPAG